MDGDMSCKRQGSDSYECRSRGSGTTRLTAYRRKVVKLLRGLLEPRIYQIILSNFGQEPICP